MRDGRGLRGRWALLIAVLASLALCASALAQDEDQYGVPPGDNGEPLPPPPLEPPPSDPGSGSDGDGCDSGEVRNAETGECERDRDCPEFSSQEEAQDFFVSRGGPDEDPHRLNGDPEEDDDACEDTDFGGDDGASPEGGVDSGLGGTASDLSVETGPSPLALGGGALALIALALAAGFAVRGRIS